MKKSEVREGRSAGDPVILGPLLAGTALRPSDDILQPQDCSGALTPCFHTWLDLE